MQISSRGPAQDVPPLTFYRAGVYVSCELWEYWRAAFPHGTVDGIFASVLRDIDDERAVFTRSLAWREPSR